MAPAEALVALHTPTVAAEAMATGAAPAVALVAGPRRSSSRQAGRSSRWQVAVVAVAAVEQQVRRASARPPLSPLESVVPGRASAREATPAAVVVVVV